MNEAIDYKIEPDDRWPVLLVKLRELPLDQRKQILIAATHYQSGEGLLNTVYMGGMATASLCRVMGIQYGEGGLTEAIENADSKTVDAGLANAIHTVEYMLANPVGKCPACGQIVRVGK